MKRLAKLEATTAENATLIVTISKYSLEKIKKYYNINEKKVRIVPNGVDTEKFKPSTNIPKEKFGLGPEPYILFVGSLIPRKGLPFLVKAAKKILKEKPDTKFLIVGDGPLKNQLKNSLETSNLLGNFIFLANINEDLLPAVYNCADVFILPSIQEGQGIVLLEAQATGKPVVAFDIGGVNEAIHNRKTGLLVKPGSTDDLAEATLKLLSDKTLRQEMGTNGRNYVSENFTWDLCAERMLKVYREALKT